ncbi:hypothetical protein DsansV1_C30g0214271 [Dioscorea sansibarensis]
MLDFAGRHQMRIICPFYTRPLNVHKQYRTNPPLPHENKENKRRQEKRYSELKIGEGKETKPASAPPPPPPPPSVFCFRV